MADKAQKARIGLYVTASRRDGYFHVNAVVVEIGPQPGSFRQDIPSDAIRNISDYDAVNGLFLHDLTVSCQGEDKQGERNRGVYAWEVSYEAYRVDRRKATEMAKTLTVIEKRLNKMTEKYGAPATYGQYMARIANAIGANEILRCVRQSSSQWGYDGCEHRYMTLQDGVRWIDGEIEAFKAKDNPKEEVA